MENSNSSNTQNLSNDCDSFLDDDILDFIEEFERKLEKKDYYCTSMQDKEFLQTNKQLSKLGKRKRKQSISSSISSKCPKSYHISKIISGGQCGADRGALEAGKALEIPTRGWAPAKFKTENGSDYSLSSVFHLCESSSSDYTERTRMNVDESDGTLVFRFKPSRGTDKTVGYAQKKKWINGNFASISETQYKPVCIIQSLDNESKVIDTIRKFIEDNDIHVLNVAGHRESQYKGISTFVTRILKMTLDTNTNVNMCRQELLND